MWRNMVKISCFTVNARSLHNKEISVWEFIWKEEMDFGVITETWYKDDKVAIIRSKYIRTKTRCDKS